MTRRNARNTKAALVYTLGVVITLIVSAPLIWLVTTSLRPLAEVVTSPPQLLPSHVNFTAYIDMWTTAPFLSFVLNSLFVAVCVTVLVLIASSMAAYALRRFNLKTERTIITIILLSQALPGASLVIPLFKTFADLQLIDTRLGLIIAYTGFLTPFCTWLLLGYFRSLPMELMEAATMDGLSHMQILFRIVIPLAAPAMAATAIFAFLGSWNEFVFALIMTRDQVVTVPVGLFTHYFAQYVNLWNQVAAASVVISIPPIVLFLFLQRQMISGLTAGAVKA